MSVPRVTNYIRSLSMQMVGVGVGGIVTVRSVDTSGAQTKNLIKTLRFGDVNMT